MLERTHVSRHLQPAVTNITETYLSDDESNSSESTNDIDEMNAKVENNEIWKYFPEMSNEEQQLHKQINAGNYEKDEFFRYGLKYPNIVQSRLYRQYKESMQLNDKDFNGRFRSSGSDTVFLWKGTRTLALSQQHLRAILSPSEWIHSSSLDILINYVYDSFSERIREKFLVLTPIQVQYIMLGKQTTELKKQKWDNYEQIWAVMNSSSGMGKHWFIVCLTNPADISKVKLQIRCSQNCKKYPKQTKALWKQYTNAIGRDIPVPPVESIPVQKQTNGYDCGFWVLHQISCIPELANGNKVSFQEELRIRHPWQQLITRLCQTQCKWKDCFDSKNARSWNYTFKRRQVSILQYPGKLVSAMISFPFENSFEFVMANKKQVNPITALDEITQVNMICMDDENLYQILFLKSHCIWITLIIKTKALFAELREIYFEIFGNKCSNLMNATIQYMDLLSESDVATACLSRNWIFLNIGQKNPLLIDASSYRCHGFEISNDSKYIKVIIEASQKYELSASVTNAIRLMYSLNSIRENTQLANIFKQKQKHSSIELDKSETAVTVEYVDWCTDALRTHKVLKNNNVETPITAADVPFLLSLIRTFCPREWQINRNIAFISHELSNSWKTEAVKATELLKLSSAFNTDPNVFVLFINDQHTKAYWWKSIQTWKPESHVLLFDIGRNDNSGNMLEDIMVQCDCFNQAFSTSMDVVNCFNNVKQPLAQIHNEVDAGIMTILSYVSLMLDKSSESLISFADAPKLARVAVCKLYSDLNQICNLSEQKEDCIKLGNTTRLRSICVHFCLELCRLIYYGKVASPVLQFNPTSQKIMYNYDIYDCNHDNFSFIISKLALKTLPPDYDATKVEHCKQLLRDIELTCIYYDTNELCTFTNVIYKAKHPKVESFLDNVLHPATRRCVQDSNNPLQQDHAWQLCNGPLFCQRPKTWQYTVCQSQTLSNYFSNNNDIKHVLIPNQSKRMIQIFDNPVVCLIMDFTDDIKLMRDEECDKILYDANDFNKCQWMVDLNATFSNPTISQIMICKYDNIKAVPLQMSDRNDKSFVLVVGLSQDDANMPYLEFISNGFRVLLCRGNAIIFSKKQLFQISADKDGASGNVMIITMSE